MLNENGRSLEEDVKQLLMENYQTNQEVLRVVKKLQRHMRFEQVMSVLKILLIVIPLIYAYMYLAPYLTQTMGMYQSLFSNDESGENAQQLQITPQMLQQLQESGVLDKYYK
jgi:hypothetical protein